jgi:hypothetical protein
MMSFGFTCSRAGSFDPWKGIAESAFFVKVGKLLNGRAFQLRDR